jgi:hypothetical protein
MQKNIREFRAQCLKMGTSSYSKKPQVVSRILNKYSGTQLLQNQGQPVERLIQVDCWKENAESETVLPNTWEGPLGVLPN